MLVSAGGVTCAESPREVARRWGDDVSKEKEVAGIGIGVGPSEEEGREWADTGGSLALRLLRSKEGLDVWRNLEMEEHRDDIWDVMEKFSLPNCGSAGRKKKEILFANQPIK